MIPQSDDSGTVDLVGVACGRSGSAANVVYGAPVLSAPCSVLHWKHGTFVLQVFLYSNSGPRMCRFLLAMKTQSPPLQSILQVLHQLSERLHGTNGPQDRVKLLREMRLLLGDADKIIGSEMGED